MPQVPKKAQTIDSTTFEPDAYFDAWGKGDLGPPTEPENNFHQFILTTFGIRPNDTYTYAAVAEVTLAQAQMHVDAGPRAGRHAWYRDGDDKPVDPPPVADIAAYVDIFRSSTSTPKALVALAANAKKGSIRASVVSHLQSLYLPPSSDHNIVVPKLKKEPVNPYLDVWKWSCYNLKWAGPDESANKIRFSHGILPVLYHHFGCVCPSYESLSIIAQLAGGRTILDIGSGNGYWTYMLRRFDTKSPMKVVPIDNGISEWRTMWVGDTQQIDGVQYLRRHSGGKDDVLLLVYPQVGLDFTSKILHAYKGDTIICAGTQNANGYTAFAGETISDWIAREMPVYGKVCQIPLPSFAGKDEALFVFQKKPT